MSLIDVSIGSQTGLSPSDLADLIDGDERGEWDKEKSKERYINPGHLDRMYLNGNDRVIDVEEKGEDFTYYLVYRSGSRNEVWRFSSDFSPESDEGVSAFTSWSERDFGGIDIDANGNIYLAGGRFDDDNLDGDNRRSNSQDIHIEKISVNGNIDWFTYFGYLDSRGRQANDFAVDIELDGSENYLFIAAYSSTPVLIKYTITGTEEWTKSIINTKRLLEIPVDIELDPDGNDVYMASHDNHGFSTDVSYVTAISGADGTILSAQILDSSMTDGTYVGEIGVSSNNLQAIGKYAPYFSALFTPKLNSNPSDLQISASSFDESITAGSVVATLSSTDEDSGDTHTYSLVSGSGDTDNSSFTIDGDELKIKESPDFETKESYSVRLQTKDSGDLSFEKSFTLSVNDLNEDPTDLLVSESTFNENISSGLVVAEFSSTDEDSGDIHTYSLVSGDGDTDNSSFTIVGDQLKVKESPDFETKSSYSIRLQTKDSGGLTFEKSFNLNVNDLNEVPADLSVSSSTFDENILSDSAVAKLSTTDTDADDTFTYSLVESDGDTDNNAFNIDGDELKIKESPDFETKSSYSIRLQTKDSGGLTFEKSFILSVNDLDEKDYDFNGDGKTTVEHDALIGLRMMFGTFPGDSLIDGAMTQDSTRSLEDIKTFMSGSVQDGSLDLDFDGNISPFTDGLQLIREIEQLQLGGGVDPLA